MSILFRLLQRIFRFSGNVVAFCVTFYLLVSGAKQSWTAYHNSEPLELTCAEFEKRPEERTWLRLRECIAPLEEAILLYEDRNGKEAKPELYIPLYPHGVYENYLTQEEEAEERAEEGKEAEEIPIPKTALLVRSTNPERIALWRELERLDNAAENTISDEQIIQFLEQNEAKLLGDQLVEGVLLTGWDRKEEEEAMIRQGEDMLTENFAIIDSEERPSWGMALGFFFCGVIGTVYLVVRLFRQ